MSRLVTVHYPDGNVLTRRVEPLTDADRALLAPVVDQIPDRDIPALIVLLMSDLADHEAYERVCATKGLLPL